MKIISCERDKGLRSQIKRFVEALKAEAHKLDNKGAERELFNFGLLCNAIVSASFHGCFKEKAEEIDYVDFEPMITEELVRKTATGWGGALQKELIMVAIRCV